jgi:hypothetical protein
MLLEQPLELGDRDKPRAPRQLHRLDQRKHAPVKRRDADAERLRRLAPRVRESHDLVGDPQRRVRCRRWPHDERRVARATARRPSLPGPKRPTAEHPFHPTFPGGNLSPSRLVPWSVSPDRDAGAGERVRRCAFAGLSMGDDVPMRFQR